MRTVFSSAVALIGLSVPLTSNGAIATWNFDSGTDNNVAYAGGATYGVNTYSHTAFTTPAPVLGATPSTTSARSAGTGNGGLALQFATSHGGDTVSGSTFTLTLKAAVNLGSVSITYDYLASNSGGGSPVNNWSWTITGGGSGSGTGSAVNITQDGNWHTTTVTFSTLNLTAGETIVFTDTLAGYPTGNNLIASFDNINVVPEPINYALAAFGLCVAGVCIGRRVYFWARA
jgi:hypothetical protein